MAYSETRIVIGGLAHVPVLIFIANFIKGKFGIKTEEIKDIVVKEEPVKIIELKNNVDKEGKAETLKELSTKLDNIEQKADEVYEKVKIKKMKITKKLWEDNYEIALLSLNTKFVQGLKNGSLPKNIFQEYLAQDYFFLETFAKAYGLAVSKSKDKYSIRKLSELLMGVSEELILHENYAKEWDIDLSNNYIKKATKNYTDFLDVTSKRRSSVEIMFAMTPCMRLYSWIGKSLYKEDFDIKYKEWIITYSDEGFEKLADSLENLIETNKETYDINHAKYLYRRAMELELDFFNAYSDF